MTVPPSHPNAYEQHLRALLFAFLDFPTDRFLCFFLVFFFGFAFFFGLAFALTTVSVAEKLPTPANVTLDGVAKIGGALGTP